MSSASSPQVEPTRACCSCASTAVEPEVLRPGMPGHGTHYSRLVCCDCGRFNGWGRNPAVTEATVARGQEIEKVLAGGRVSQWEREFLQSIARQRHLTDRQESTWKKIKAKAGL